MSATMTALPFLSDSFSRYTQAPPRRTIQNEASETATTLGRRRIDPLMRQRALPPLLPSPPPSPLLPSPPPPPPATTDRFDLRRSLVDLHAVVQSLLIPPLRGPCEPPPPPRRSTVDPTLPVASAL